MGRIRDKLIKGVAQDLLENPAYEFTADFGKNKEILKTLDLTHSPRIRNRIAGYLARMAARSA